jgi:hypothetical protein
MKVRKVFVTANASLILLLLAACNALKPTPAPTQTPEVLPTTGVQHKRRRKPSR